MLAMLRNYPLAARTHVRPDASRDTCVERDLPAGGHAFQSSLRIATSTTVCRWSRQQIPARSNWAESHRALPCLDGLIFDVARCSGASLAKHPQRQVSNLIGRDALVQDQRA